MAANKAEIAKQLFNIILGMGMGGAARGGISSSSIANFVNSAYNGGVSGNMDRFLAKNYPTEFPSSDGTMEFTVHHVDSKTPNMNAEGNANYDVIDEAGRMQTLEEHNKALSKYIDMLPPSIRANPKKFHEAILKGQQAEKDLPAYWADPKPRREFSVSSSAVSGIRLTPDGRVEVRWASKPDTWYTFKQYPDNYQASLAAQKLLQAPSIGRAVMPFQRNGKRLVFKNKNVQYSGWNEPNYDSAFA